MALRILSYNIRGLPWIHCPIEAILLWSQVKLQSPCDILCLQEVFTSHLRSRIMSLAPVYGYQVIFAPFESVCFGKSYLGFESSCGLCILVKNNIPIVKKPEFTRFLNTSGLDCFVQKGFLSIGILYKGQNLQIVNTHLQSDFDDLPCFSLVYEETRVLQEYQLHHHFLEYEFPILIGDFNTDKFSYFEKFDENFVSTFPRTCHHLDHLLVPRHLVSRIQSKKVVYFHHIDFSDHIPMIFEFTL